jgi:hypothetical protein
MMTTQQLADKIVELNRTGKGMEGYAYFADHAEANERGAQPMGDMPTSFKGKEAIIAASQAWMDGVEEMHGGEVSDALVAGNTFAIRMMMDVTMKGQERMQMEEICVYRVEDGMITLAEYFY